MPRFAAFTALGTENQPERAALYTAALPAAHKWNPALVTLRTRLTARVKTHKQALVACAGKFITYANAILERGTPWITKPHNP